MSFRSLKERAGIYFRQLQTIDLLQFNQFIFKHLLLHLFKTENIFPFIAAACVIGFSIVVQCSRFIFIPQTSVGAFASFFLFTLVVSVIILVIYPLFIILLANFLCSFLNLSPHQKLFANFSILFSFLMLGIIFLTNKSITLETQVEIIIIWLGLYFILTGLYLTHQKHQTIFKLTKTKMAFIIFISLLMTRPLILIFLHTSEAMNFTNINPQVYLSAQNCALLHNLDGKHEVPHDNNILYNADYYRELPQNQGCFIYGNTIRYGFAYDFVLMVKKNIRPIIGRNGHTYNSYTRLSCYANNCYSENMIFVHTTEDLNSTLIEKGGKLDYPL